MTDLRGFLVGVFVLTLLGGCAANDSVAVPSPIVTDTETVTPTATPVPTRPALADLVITPDGLGTLVIGSKLPDTGDPSTAMVAWDADYCVNEDFGIAKGDELAGGWKPDPAYDFADGNAFQVFARAGVLERLDVYVPAIATETGIHVGDSRAAVLAAYPAAKPVMSSPISELYRSTAP